jgi:hypothetical protein
MNRDSAYKTKAKEYTINRIDDDVFELWHDDTHLATIAKEEAWSMMLGKIHPEDFLRNTHNDANTSAVEDSGP